MKITGMNQNTININSQSYVGNNVSIVGGRVIIDGVEQTSKEPLSRIVNIAITGNCGDIQNDVGDVTVTGSVTGDVKTGCGDIRSGDVTGNASTGTGDIKCGTIGGNARTGVGDITHK